MGINWSNWEYSGGNGMRVGIEATHTAVNSASTDVTWTIKYYTQNQYNYSDNQELNYSGTFSGSHSYTNNDGSSIQLRDTRTNTYTYVSWGSSPGTRTFAVSVSGAYNGVTPSVSGQVDIPVRPYALPAAQSSVVLTRNSDTQATLTWTRNTSASAPYSSQTVQFRKWTSLGSWGEWETSVIATGGATSYVKTGLSANNVYQMQIRSNNSTGSSSFVVSNVIFTTPAPPTGVTSALLSGGTSIQTSWVDHGYVYTTPSTWTIQRSVAGGAFADVVTGLTQTTTTWVDPSPGAGTNQYRVAAVRGSLTSAYATGNVVSTIVAPNAPTNLVPNGVAVDFNNDAVLFTWQHNHGGDGAAQSHFTIETSIDSGGSWQPLSGATDIASATQSFSLPAGTLVNGVPYLWRVRTEGIVSAGYGPNSASAAVTGSTRPTATLSSPPSITGSYPITATWAYNQDEGSPQIAWEANLYANDGTSLLEQRVGSGTTSTVPFTYAAISGVSYVVGVRVRSGAGLWSHETYATTTFLLLPPGDAVVTAEYQECFGTVLLHLEAGATVPGVTVDTDTVKIERRTAESDWVTLGTSILLPTDFLDLLPATHGQNLYRVTAYSTLPSLSTGPVIEVTGGDGTAPGDPLWVWVAYGDHFEYVLRLHGDPQISETSSRVKAQQHFLGRAKPVALVGENTDRSISVSGSLRFDAYCTPSTALENLSDCVYDSAPTMWRQAGRDSEVVCYRDFTGRRMFGTLGEVTVTDGVWPGKADVGFQVIEVDFIERYVQFVEEEP